MPRYRIPNQKDLIKQLVSNAKIDEVNNNCLRLQGDYSQGFVKGIEAHESEKIDFKKIKGFVWTKPMRSTTPFLRINGYCGTCKATGSGDFVKYKIILAENPVKQQLNCSRSGNNFVDVLVERTGDHISVQRSRILPERKFRK